MSVLLLLLLAQALPTAPALRSGCSQADEELVRLKPEDALKVQGSVAGGEQTCYKVILTRDGKDTTGYLLGETTLAVTDFVRERERIRKEALEAQARANVDAAASKPAADTSQPLPAGVPPVFDEFSGRDTNGKPVSLSGIGGKVILVTFWSPQSKASTRQLVALQSLYSQLKNSGLRAIGISSDPRSGYIAEALDDVVPAFPQIPDRYGLTKRYADGKPGMTLVLDSSHHIVAAGLTGAALEKKIRELLAMN
jgi:hypothetical protein